MKEWICVGAAALLAVSMLSGCSGGSGGSSVQAQTTQAQTESQTESIKAGETNGNAETGSAANGSEAGVKESEVAGGPSAEELEAVVGTHHVKTTVKNYGTIDVTLDGDNAPITIANFLRLAGNGFYSGFTFYRIMSGFMIQGGDPLDTSMGDSDEEVKGEFANSGVEDPPPRTREAISMARSRTRDSASSQFFIVHRDSIFLDGKYACFGCVAEGMEVVDAICKDIQPVDSDGTVLKENRPVIQGVEVIDQEVP